MSLRHAEHLSFRSLVAGLVIGSLSPAALAATPRIVGRPVVKNPVFNGTPNTMMYNVTVTVDGTGADADHAAVVGFVSDGDYTTCDDEATSWKWSASRTFAASATRTWTLYNFVPGTAYHYKVVVGDPAGTPRVKCGLLQTRMSATPTLPENLSYLNLQYASAGASDPYETKYVLLETEDCGTGGGANAASYYLVIVDPVNEAIVWYLDVAAVSGVDGAVGSGLDYEPGATPAEDRIHLSVDKQSIFEWGFDQRELGVYDFGSDDQCNGMPDSVGPCAHHDVVRSETTGNVYAVAAQVSSVNPTDTEWDAACPPTSRFLDEGFLVLDPSWSLTDTHFLMTDYGYDPTVDGGPRADELVLIDDACASRFWGHTFDPANGVIDWTHVNALAVSSVDGADVIDLSLKEWDQVIRFDAATGDRLWSLSPHAGYTDWGTMRLAPGIAGRPAFSDQHDAHAIGPDTLMMLDNGGSPAGSRVLEIELSEAPLGATVEKSWALVDADGNAVRCPIEGTAQQVPGSTDDHVLSMCAGEYSIMELDDPTGNTGVAPPLHISLPDGTSDDFCTSGGPTDRSGLQGWHKSYPLEHIGEF